ncbi:MAG: carbohydrate ABC transporter permease [Sphaerochaetaceae bacterium]|nr:carbohydrate ABC transporter permease [Sphaerochaetaceae bacterium]
MKRNRMMYERFDLFSILGIILFITLVLLSLFPLLWMLVTSFKTLEETHSIPPAIWPNSLFIDNYLNIFSDKFFPRYFLNSVIISVLITVVAVGSSVLMGYVFAKFEFPGKKLLFWAILATIMIPEEAYVVPLYQTVSSLKLTNSYLGIILPSIISSFGVFYMKQNMESVPNELLEAAKIDGSGNLNTFVKVVVPLQISSISVLSLLLFLIAWSDYLWPLIVVSKQRMYVLEIGLTYLQNQYYIDWGFVMAGCVIAMAPVFILFLIARNYVMEGIAMTGIKG